MTETTSSPHVDRRTALKALAAAGAGVLTLGLSANGQAAERDDRLQNALSRFGVDARKKLTGLLNSSSFSGQIPAATIADVMASDHQTIEEVMLGLVPVAQLYSHPPISDYHVGAVARGKSGDLYLGFNIEMPGQGLGYAVHGEQAACSSAYMHGEQGIEIVAVNGAPCGHCRQFMNEFAPDGNLQVIAGAAGAMKLSSLLPLAFGPKNLGRTEGAVPVREMKLELARRDIDPAIEAAFDAAQKSYAPYSSSHSGVAIATRLGRIYRGSYIENVAFNPSLPPLQTALVQMIVAGEEYSAIVRVVLVEAAAKITQKPATEAVAAAIARGVKVEVFSARGA